MLRSRYGLIAAAALALTAIAVLGTACATRPGPPADRAVGASVYGRSLATVTGDVYSKTGPSRTEPDKPHGW